MNMYERFIHKIPIPISNAIIKNIFDEQLENTNLYTQEICDIMLAAESQEIFNIKLEYTKNVIIEHVLRNLIINEKHLILSVRASLNIDGDIIKTLGEEINNIIKRIIEYLALQKTIAISVCLGIKGTNIYPYKLIYHPINYKRIIKIIIKVKDICRYHGKISLYKLLQRVRKDFMEWNVKKQELIQIIKLLEREGLVLFNSDIITFVGANFEN